MKKYKNQEIDYKVKLKEVLPLLYYMIKNKSKKSVASKEEIPVKYLTKRDLLELDDYSVTRLGHSTLLFKLENEFYLTDPVFSLRASPFSFLGPKRFHDVPISIKELPLLKAVIISHDHYDHLDKQSIKELKNKTETFYTTLGVGKRLKAFGIKSDNIVELNWNQKVTKDKFEFICTPAQHFSGRALFDKDSTLWSSWVINAPKGKFFFGADGGYFNGFKEIGFNYGPFDMSFLEVGAYNEKWSEIHMLPQQSIQAHKDLNAKIMFPVHNGTFDLSVHAWDEPFEKISALAKEENIPISFPIMGESIPLLSYKKTEHWWKT